MGASMATCTSDLLIVGGGPAGLSAAINAGSEGLNVRLLDNGPMLGGQAKESSGIENYPGFVESITGEALMGNMARQARKFAASVISPVAAAKLTKNGDGTITVLCDDYSEYTSRSILLSMGLQYRRLAADNIGQFVGRGVYYGSPTHRLAGHVHTICVVGGANSAGQAALGLAKDRRLDVKLLIRGSITAGMSTYLIERIKVAANIEVIELCEVKACAGTSCLRGLTLMHEGVERTLVCDAMYIFIGAVPKTLWLRGDVELDDKNFVLTGQSDTWFDERHELQTDHRAFYETSMKGVFAAGDVRSGSTKRIAAAIGEGVGALQMIHKFLGE